MYLFENDEHRELRKNVRRFAENGGWVLELPLDAAADKATARLTGKTGVEMEALTAASIALLTIYDMVKAMERDACISDIRLLAKSGGKSGAWRANA